MLMLKYHDIMLRVLTDRIFDTHFYIFKKVLFPDMI
jgi:hypothetical protein